MTNSIPLSDLEGSASAKFAAIGDRYVGRIIALDERPQTDLSGRPVTWDDGRPKMLWVITLEQADGNTVALWAKGGKYQPATGTGESMLRAIGTAAREAGGVPIEVGGELAVEHTGLAEPKPGKSAAKLYTAAYRPPTAAPAKAIPSDLFND